MATYKYGDIWSVWEEADLFLITTNSTVRSGRLVMGAGIAKDAKMKFRLHEIDVVLGQEVAKQPALKTELNETVHRPYYLLISDNWPASKMGLFQTKDHYRDKSDLYLIAGAVDALIAWIDHASVKIEREPIIHMPYPGIGNGGLLPGDVEVYIKRLPDNVNIWRFPHQKPVKEFVPPETHPLRGVYDAGEEGFMQAIQAINGMTQAEAKEAYYKIYASSPSDTSNGRLMQYLTIKGFIELRELIGEERAINEAFHIGRNEMSRILQEAIDTAPD